MFALGYTDLRPWGWFPGVGRVLVRSAEWTWLSPHRGLSSLVTHLGLCSSLQAVPLPASTHS